VKQTALFNNVQRAKREGKFQATDEPDRQRPLPAGKSEVRVMIKLCKNY